MNGPPPPAVSFRGSMMYQSNKSLMEATNSVQFLQIGEDGSRQGNYFLSSAPGSSKNNGYDGGLNQTAMYGGGPVNQFSIAGP
jgi:hypothetical protein